MTKKEYGEFQGFYRPRFTPIPDDFFDVLLPTLSGAELKVLLYILRHTFGYKKDFDRISLSQICSGIIKKDGERQDAGTGLHRETAVIALRELERRRIIVATRSESKENGNEITTYQPRLVGENDQEKITSEPTPPSRKRSLKVIGNSDPQETDSQETEIQESRPPRIIAADEISIRLKRRKSIADVAERLPDDPMIVERVRTALGRWDGSCGLDGILEQLERIR